MTWDEDAHRIHAHGGAYSAHGTRMTAHSCEFSVGDHCAKRNLVQLGPNLILEIRAMEIERDAERLLRSFEVRREFFECLCDVLLGRWSPL